MFFSSFCCGRTDTFKESFSKYALANKKCMLYVRTGSWLVVGTDRVFLLKRFHLLATKRISKQACFQNLSPTQVENWCCQTSLHRPRKAALVQVTALSLSLSLPCINLLSTSWSLNCDVRTIPNYYCYFFKCVISYIWTCDKNLSCTFDCRWKLFFCAGDFNDSLSFNIWISFDCKLETFWPSALQHKKKQTNFN